MPPFTDLEELLDRLLSDDADTFDADEIDDMTDLIDDESNGQEIEPE